MVFSKFSCLLTTRIISLGKYLLKFFANFKIRMLVFITELQEFLINFRYKFLFRYDLQILSYILWVAISDFFNFSSDCSLLDVVSYVFTGDDFVL